MVRVCLHRMVLLRHNKTHCRYYHTDTDKICGQTWRKMFTKLRDSTVSHTHVILSHTTATYKALQSNMSYLVYRIPPRNPTELIMGNAIKENIGWHLLVAEEKRQWASCSLAALCRSEHKAKLSFVLGTEKANRYLPIINSFGKPQLQ